MESLQLVLAAFTLSFGAWGNRCVDDNDAMGELTRQQFGQTWGCKQIILERNQQQICDDAQDFGNLCCATCVVMYERLRTQFEQEFENAGPQIGRLSSLFQGGNLLYRSVPLHERGQGMPLLALGTNELKGPKAFNLLLAALQVGYRHIDSAILYGTHGVIHQAVMQSGVPREELFITSKIPPYMMGFSKATEAVRQISEELPGGYADLCLVHWPCVMCSLGLQQRTAWTIVERAGSWRALEDAFRANICRAIGVSNYMEKHLEELFEYAEVRPSVMQLEYSPLTPLRDLATFCRQHGIILEGYGWYRSEILEHPQVQDVAQQLARPAADVVAMWFLQQGLVPLYKTARLERLLEYAEVLCCGWMLSQEQIGVLESVVLDDYPWKYYNGKVRHKDYPPPWAVPAISDLNDEGRQKAG